MSALNKLVVVEVVTHDVGPSTFDAVLCWVSIPLEKLTDHSGPQFQLSFVAPGPVDLPKLAQPFEPLPVRTSQIVTLLISVVRPGTPFYTPGKYTARCADQASEDQLKKWITSEFPESIMVALPASSPRLLAKRP